MRRAGALPNRAAKLLGISRYQLLRRMAEIRHEGGAEKSPDNDSINRLEPVKHDHPSDLADQSSTLRSRPHEAAPKDGSTRTEPGAIRGRSQRRISYSSATKIPAVSSKALRLGAGKRVFCITAGGGRVLQPALRSSPGILAVDVNPTQNHPRAQDRGHAASAIALPRHFSRAAARDRLKVYQACGRPSPTPRSLTLMRTQSSCGVVCIPGEPRGAFSSMSRGSRTRCDHFGSGGCSKFDDIAKQRHFPRR